MRTDPSVPFGRTGTADIELDSGITVLGGNNGPRNPQIQESRHDACARQQTSPGSDRGQRLHGGEQKRPTEGVIAHPAVPLRIQGWMRHQHYAGLVNHPIVHIWQTGRRTGTARLPPGRRTVHRRGDNQRHRLDGLSATVQKPTNALFDRNRRDMLACQILKNIELSAHSDFGPNAERRTGDPHLRISLPERRQIGGQGFVRQRIAAIAGQTHSTDDRA